MIAHSRPCLGQREARAAADVVLSGQIAQGKQVRALEQDLCRETGMKYSCAVSSGVAALHLALLAIGVGDDDEVVVPSFVCTALLHAVRYVGAKPVVADIDPRTGNIDPMDAERRTSRRTKAIIVPHMFGLPADMDRILKLNIPVVEDCAQSIGAEYKGRPTGNLGEAAVFSFYATKMIASGEGGMAASNSEAFIRKVRDMRDYDNRDDDETRFNYKATDILAAVGRVQLARLRGFIERRKMIADKYDSAFRDLDFGLPVREPGRIYYRYAIRLRDNADPDRWVESLREKGVHCARPVYRPLHRYIGGAELPGAEDAWRRWLSIPIYPSMTDESVDFVVRAVYETREKLAFG